MKVCFLTETMFVTGGVCRVVTSLANALLQQGVQVEIVCIREDPPRDYGLFGLNGEIPVHMPEPLLDRKNRYPLRRLLRGINQKKGKIPRALLDWVYLPKSEQRALKAFIEEKGYDAVIAAQGRLSLTLARLAPSLRCRCLGWQHSTFEAYFRTKGTYYWNRDELYRKYLKNLYRYVVINDQDVAKVSGAFGADNVQRIYNMVPPVAVPQGKPPEERRYDVIFVGQLRREAKGLDYLIEILAAMKQRRPHLRAVIVGDGQDRDFLKDALAANGLTECVDCVGFHTDVGAWYAESRLLAVTSRWEGFSLVAVEAMSAGLPVVAFASPGPVEILTNTGAGALIECFDTKAFAEAALSLLEDPEGYANMSEAARKRAGDFTPERIVSEWMDLL